MPQTFARASTTRRPVARAAVCLSLALGASAHAADLAPVRPVPLPRGPAAGSAPQPASRIEPEAGLGLFQRLALLLDALATGRAVAAPLADGPMPREAPPGTAARVIPYGGPLAAGTVVLNLDRFQVYRILDGGWAELYQEHSEGAALARIGMAR